ncbi:hypothetical protein KBZ15_07815 [Cyanobium sp. BA20m-p-22]|nr:hypothetical protein [Cyanobium sp. BA20m-p-22]
MPISLHPALASLLPRLQLVQNCWHLLAGRREHSPPSGFFRDALRTLAGMLASGHWRIWSATTQLG